MSADDGLDVVLTWLTLDGDDLVAQAHADVDQANETSRKLDELGARAAELRRQVGLEDAPPKPPLSLWAETLQRPAAGASASPQWDALRRQAEDALRARGVDPGLVDIDDLLDPDEVRRIARRFIGGFTVRAHLDRHDLAIMLIAGLAAALVDWLVVNGAPTSLEQLRKFRPDKDGLTSFFRDHAVDSNNWLGDRAHASFDQQRSAGGSTLPGFTPTTHRDLSLGHDPLLALIVGVRDVMNGSMTTPGTLSDFRTLAGSQLPVSNPYLAVMIVVAHLLSDAFTPMGLPAPGWTLVNSLQFGSFDTDGVTAAAESVRMYSKGYDCRHFLTMSTSVAAAEIVLRAYWALRCEFDEEYAEDVRREGEVAASEAVSDHPRYLVLAFGAHALACAANAGKVALSGNNWLLFNVPEWTRFVQVSLQLASSRSVSPTDVLVRTGLSNIEALANGWPDVDIADPRLPTIRGESATGASR
jgi:hypothetical protein